jgi:hypothetical protein
LKISPDQRHRVLEVTAIAVPTIFLSNVIGLGIFEPKQMLVFDQNEGPGFSIPVRGLVLGLFLFQSNRA